MSGATKSTMWPEKEVPLPGPYTPTVILHGGAGNITRKNLPPDLYVQYESSLLKYLDSTRKMLSSGASALDSAVHAVSLMEDDPLFNCGRGSVFTEKGTIEMEASVMVASVDPKRASTDDGGKVAEAKRGAGVMLVRNTRYPIQLAREVLLKEPDGKLSSMHCQLSGPDVEEWAWEKRGLEKKDDGWFWTERRWAEHLRGLRKDSDGNGSGLNGALRLDDDDPEYVTDEDHFLPSQGTVGAVCLDSLGTIAVATSTGGLTNKKVGRIGDTPTLGAGYWAESWEEPIECSTPTWPLHRTTTLTDRLSRAVDAGFGDLLQQCFPHVLNTNDQESHWLSSAPGSPPTINRSGGKIVEMQPHPPAPAEMLCKKNPRSSSDPTTLRRRRAVAISGTGNGDSFLRTAACRTTAAICRFSTTNPSQVSTPISLARAVEMTAGPGGELQQSAGDRWKVTGEGQAGMIGIEVYGTESEDEIMRASCRASELPCGGGRVVYDFNCGGLWRAWVDEETGRGKVMVFREEYGQGK